MKDIQIVIPMTGNGSRFSAAGYDRLKPFIDVHGTPMIEWVTRMFPGYEDNILFVCRQEHVDTLPYVHTTLRRIAPNAQIVCLDDWEKKGPVSDVLRVSGHIDDEKPVIVSYCDFYMQWDFDAFLEGVASRGCQGCVPCYSGFHPHLTIAENLYASCKVDDTERLIEIREKFSWNPDKTKTRHSPGVYFMDSGRILKKYFAKLMASGRHINGEFYASLPFQFMADAGLDVWCPVNVSKFCQWGTPRDLEQYLYWTETVLKAHPASFSARETVT